jgi:hypothetical protein
LFLTRIFYNVGFRPSTQPTYLMNKDFGIWLSKICANDRLSIEINGSGNFHQLLPFRLFPEMLRFATQKKEYIQKMADLSLILRLFPVECP